MPFSVVPPHASSSPFRPEFEAAFHPLVASASKPRPGLLASSASSLPDVSPSDHFKCGGYISRFRLTHSLHLVSILTSSFSYPSFFRNTTSASEANPLISHSRERGEHIGRLTALQHVRISHVLLGREFGALHLAETDRRLMRLEARDRSWLACLTDNVHRLGKKRSERKSG